jgi:hypothetical protein
MACHVLAARVHPKLGILLQRVHVLLVAGILLLGGCSNSDAAQVVIGARAVAV